MRAVAFVAGLAAGGCGAKPNAAYCDHHPTDHAYCAWLDAAPSVADTPPDANMFCIGAGTFALCVDPPTAPVTLSGDFDSDLAPECAATQNAMWKANGQPDACIVTGTTIMVSNVVAHGGRPLVLLASDTMTVTGLDVSSKNGAATVGAGFDAAVCTAFAQSPVAASSGAGGGAGGTYFGAAGGTGGQGSSGSTSGGMAGAAIAMPAILRGGCPGQDGAIGTTVAGPGGPGGGAMYLAATNELVLTNATLLASGAGGNGGSRYGGAGGGGSGGMIVLSAAVIGASGATLIANGGGGGAGGPTGSTGAAGSDPSPTMATVPASGPSGSSGGGSGGNGFAGSNVALPGGLGSYGGGGGGGGGGYIQANHTLATQMISPAVVTM